MVSSVLYNSKAQPMSPVLESLTALEGISYCCIKILKVDHQMTLFGKLVMSSL